MNLRENRIRALARRIHQVTGRTDEKANWHQAASLIDAYPSHDFDVRANNGRFSIYLADRHNRHAVMPI